MLIAQHILRMVEGIVDIKPSVIEATLRDAKSHVLSDGVPEINTMFDLLHKYYTMHLLQLWGHIEDTISEEVGDIKSTYAKAEMPAGDTKWFVLYQRELAKIVGP